jgi:hypothetical protein
MPPKTPKPDPLLRRFLSWLRRVVFGEQKSRYAKVLEEVRAGVFGRLVAIERFTPNARFTWRFIPNYDGCQIFLYCDSIEYLKGRKTLDTHRLTLILVSGTGRSSVYWSRDFEMKSIYGQDNCAAIVTRLLATRLLHHRYDEIAWGDLAEKYVATHRKN